MKNPSKIEGKADKGHRRVTLTFDDGPHPVYTPHILDVLLKHRIEACFFVLGERVDASYGHHLLERLRREGHQVGNHSYSHPNLALLSEEQIRSEISRAHASIQRAWGSCQYFRPPFGSNSARLQRIVSEFKYNEIRWDVDTEDWKRRENGGWVEFGLEKIRSRKQSIVLLHDIHKSTAEHLDRFIGRLKSEEATTFARIPEPSVGYANAWESRLPAFQDDWTLVKEELMGIRNRFNSATSPTIPAILQEMLVCAEDHRFMHHSGYDLKAILRAAFRTMMGNPQGGSTIAQQLARVVTGRYERSFRRKIREIRLAKRITETFPRKEIPALYLLIGYFGWRMNGLAQAYRRLDFSGSELDAAEAARLIARLKYPEPRVTPATRRTQIETRGAYISRLHSHYRMTDKLPGDFFSEIK